MLVLDPAKIEGLGLTQGQGDAENVNPANFLEQTTRQITVIKETQR